MKADKQVRETILKHNLIEKGDHIVIGLSGGPDSMCLFSILLDVAGEMNLTIHPVHVNHKFRPGDAEEDQAFVENFCAEIAGKYPERVKACRSFVVDCNALADELGMTSEEAGRKARYDAFYHVAEEVSAGLDSVVGSDRNLTSTEDGGSSGTDSIGVSHVKIAVAQNANDQAETILFRLLRGTGTDGLAGIAFAREERRQSVEERAPRDGKAHDEKAYKVIRPLLETWREDIEEYCCDRELNPVIDHTNSEELYSRNRIRLDLIPYIKDKYNENIEAGLNRLGTIAAADKEYFWLETGRVFRELKVSDDAAPDGNSKSTVVLDREGLASCHASIRHRVVQRAFEEIGLVRDITAERLEGADAIILKKQGEKIVEFPHGYRIRVAKGRVYFERLHSIVK